MFRVAWVLAERWLMPSADQAMWPINCVRGGSPKVAEAQKRSCSPIRQLSARRVSQPNIRSRWGWGIKVSFIITGSLNWNQGGERRPFTAFREIKDQIAGAESNLARAGKGNRDSIGGVSDLGVIA